MAGQPGDAQAGGVKVLFDPKLGEVQQLKELLSHSMREKKKEALKKIIQAMTIGVDVSSLFPDVVNCMHSISLDLKKLVYLYVINYAKSQPELAILAIHAFRKDASDPHNPFLRALAVRTMGCIRLEQMTEYLLEPLRRSCKDPDAYVRKTATLCIAKLFDINRELVEDQGFIDILRDMLSDSNPMVVANAVASLCEISYSSKRDYLRLSEDVVSKLLPALAECSEWGQVFILDALALYDPPNTRVAEAILERGVLVRLSHANCAVVLSAIKFMMKFMNRLESPEMKRNLCRKMTPPLVTLLSAEPEIQYVVMRNISLIVQSQPQILQSEIRMFVCKYNDPLYVKIEKIAVMVQLANERNIDQVLSEFREYASEVDIEVVRKSVRAIGQCAIKVDLASERCVDCLLDLIRTKVNYVVQEAICVIRDVFRKYPGKYEVIISDLCENLENLDEPEAKASMVWIIGEYADRIDEAGSLLASFVENFHEEATIVQQQILTAVVKLCLKRQSQANNGLASQVLKIATEECNDPDLRDRGYLYWRMMSKSPEMAKQVVLSERPTISDTSLATQPRVLDALVRNISTLASVYHQLPEQFLSVKAETAQESDADEEFEGEQRDKVARAASEMRQGQGANYVEDSGDEDDNASGSGSSSDDGPGRDRSASSSGPRQERQPLRSIQEVMSESNRGANNGVQGLKIAAGILRSNRGVVGLRIMVRNMTGQPMNGWAIQANHNPFGFAPQSPELQFGEVQGGGQAQAQVVLVPDRLLSNTPPTEPLVLQFAIKNNADIWYISVSYDLSVALVESGPAPKDQFQQLWQQLPAAQKAKSIGQFGQRVTPEQIQERMEMYGVYLVARIPGSDFETMYFSATTTNGLVVYCELMIQRSAPGVQFVCASPAPPLVPPFQSFGSELLHVRWQGPPGGAPGP